MKKNKLPKFKSEEEEAKFWDNNSPLEYKEEFAEVEEPFEFSPSLLRKAVKTQKERKRLLTLRMEPYQIDVAKLIARWKGCGYQTLMRMWVMEGLRREVKIHPEIKEFLSFKK